MIPKPYANWIDEHYPDYLSARGKCREACLWMRQGFPELKVTNGFVSDGEAKQMHWWCLSPDGKIIDPTARQFLDYVTYEEIDDSRHHRNS